MTCSNCSRTIDPSSSFCDFCGTPVKTRDQRGYGQLRCALPERTAGDPWVTSPPDLGPPDAGPPAAAPGPLPAPQPGAPPDRHWPGGPALAMGPAPVIGAETGGRVSQLDSSAEPLLPLLVRLLPPSPGVLPGSPILLGYQERILRQYGAVQLRNRAHG